MPGNSTTAPLLLHTERLLCALCVFRTSVALSSGQEAPRGNEFCPRKPLKVHLQSYPAPHLVTLRNPSPLGGFPACHTGDPGSIPGSARFPGEGSGFPLQYSCLENPMDRGAWRAIVHEVAKSWTRLSNSDAGRDWGQEEKGTAEDEMAGWHR